MIRNDLLGALRTMGISPDLVDDVPELPSDVRALMVYGSQARGDAVEGSDLDLLALVDRSRATLYGGNVNVGFYTSEQLASGIGTLFGAHLRRDGKVVFDTNGELSAAIEAMGEVDTDRLLRRSWLMAELFTNLDRDLPKYLAGLLREARYLLRSCLYARAIAEGAPCFSVRELAVRHDDPDLVDLLASRHTRAPTEDELTSCLGRLAEIVGAFPVSSHGSLEATVVNEWASPGDLLSMAFLALGVTGRGSDYAEVEKILL